MPLDLDIATLARSAASLAAWCLDAPAPVIAIGSRRRRGNPCEMAV